MTSNIAGKRDRADRRRRLHRPQPGAGAEAARRRVAVIDSLQVNNLLSLHCQTQQPTRTASSTSSIINERLDLLREADMPLHVEDARDYHALSRDPQRRSSRTSIVQLAAVAHANRSNKDPYHTFDHSMRTLENALD